MLYNPSVVLVRNANVSYQPRLPYQLQRTLVDGEHQVCDTMRGGMLPSTRSSLLLTLTTLLLSYLDFYLYPDIRTVVVAIAPCLERYIKLNSQKVTF